VPRTRPRNVSTCARHAEFVTPLSLLIEWRRCRCDARTITGASASPASVVGLPGDAAAKIFRGCRPIGQNIFSGVSFIYPARRGCPVSGRCGNEVFPAFASGDVAFALKALCDKGFAAIAYFSKNFVWTYGRPYD
jgi:hypothetical protein